MKLITLDASVAIKFFIPEIHAPQAQCLLNKKYKLLAPDLIFAEIGNILWKKSARNELDVPVAQEILNDFKKMPIQIYASEMLIDEALKIATRHHCTVYDSLYVALAKMENGVLVTADKALFNTLKITALGKYVGWVEDVVK